MSKARMEGIENKADVAERITREISAANSPLLRVALITGMFYLLLELLLLAEVRPMLAQTVPIAAGVRLEAGIEKEDVDGDLKSAMDIYQKIAADTSAPRDVRAKALLRLAGCDEKLGKQAKQVYEQIVRDYADQPPAAKARIRLAALKQQEHPTPPTTMSVRKIESTRLSGMFGDCDTDGERAMFYDPNGNLFFGDLAGHSKRLIFKGEPDSPGRLTWTASRDFSVVALAPAAKPGRPATIAVAKIDGTGYRELVRDDAKGNILGGNNLFGTNWSWDDRNLLVPIYFGGKTDNLLWIVSAFDGQRRELVRTERYIPKAVFSPDGHYVAYASFPKDAQSVETSRIYVVPTQGGEPRLVYESGPWSIDNRFNILMDWTADGKYLAIKDVRLGKSALYLLPMTNGAASGPAVFVRYGEFEDGYTTLSGALVYGEPGTRPAQVSAFLASLDTDGHLGSWKHLDLRGRLDERGNPLPSFSPDGSQIAYLAGDEDPARQDIVLRDLSTGHERVLYQTTSKNLRCQFSAHSPNIFCTESVDDAGGGKTELISVAEQSGLVEHVASFQGARTILQPPLDDKIFYFSAADNYSPGVPPIVRWERSAQQETVVSNRSTNYRIEAPSLDDNWLVRMMDGSLQVRPMSGGDWKSLVSGIEEQLPPETTPDGKWILYHAIDPVAGSSLYRLPFEGGQPQRLGDFPIHDLMGDPLRVSPTGRNILALDNVFTSFDVWLLEHFEPSAK